MGNIRIISGEHRGRKLSVPDGVRPTSDRTREMLFNWLQYEIVGARCCDLFAGTGALGLEAISRGAGYVDFIEKSPQTVKSLSQIIDKWRISNATIHNQDAQSFVENIGNYDVVFVDAPFDLSVDQFLEKIKAPIVYVETARDTDFIIPHIYKVNKQKNIGDVRATLLRLE